MKNMNSSLMIPSSSSSSSHIQTPANFDHDEFLDHILSSAPWPSISDDGALPPHPPTSDGGIAAFNHDNSRLSQQQQQHIMMMPLPTMANDVVDGSIHALYNGFAGSLHASAHSPSNHSLPLHLPQVSGGIGGMMKQGQGQTPASASTTTVTGGKAAGQSQTKPKVRARRGQATDPHSIAERLRRERIAERMKALQELVPNGNKTDKASMLDEIIDYVKFLQLQVKVLSMSRLGGAASVSSHISEGGGGGGDRVEPGGSHGNQATAAAAESSNDGLVMTEHQVAKLMEEDMGSAMQYLQNKGLCLMPISLATAISTATCQSRNPLLSGVGPSSPNVSVMTVQSTNTTTTTTTTVGNGNGVTERLSIPVKEVVSVTKP